MLGGWHGEMNEHYIKENVMLLEKILFPFLRPILDIKHMKKNIGGATEWNPLDYGAEYDFSRPFF